MGLHETGAADNDLFNTESASMATPLPPVLCCCCCWLHSAHTEVLQTNRGFQLLLRMGWQEGRGLGSKQQVGPTERALEALTLARRAVRSPFRLSRSATRSASGA